VSARVIAWEVGVCLHHRAGLPDPDGAVGLGWPLAPDLTDQALSNLLFLAPSSKPGARRYPEPDWPVLVRKLKRPDVSLGDRHRHG
jgi:transposase